ncbi:hypothetical protein EDD86DRAFT_273568, partial [Gorgonomyces haynaldii]
MTESAKWFPNQPRFVDNLFEQWILLKETQDYYLFLQDSTVTVTRQEEVTKDHLVPPRSPSRSRKSTPPASPRRAASPLRLEEADLEGPSQPVTKKDSGIDFETEKPRPSIPSFYFPFGQPQLEQDDLLEEKLKILFKVTTAQPDGEEIKTPADLGPITVCCGLSRYLNASLFRLVHKQPINFTNFTSKWKQLTQKYHSKHALVFAVIANDQKHATDQDFKIVANDVTLNHPALEFLSQLPVFQTKYVETVVTRLFYSKTHNWNKNMTLQEFKKSLFLESLDNLDNVEDINSTQDVFSYQHFYVIYCKFWELDRDHDMVIDLQALQRYDGGAMTQAILKRVIQGCGKPSSLGNLQKMSYEDFVWFILSVEDKSTPQAIEYWFRCVDLDGDGCISIYEMQHFFEEQHQRMVTFRISDAWKFQDFVCSIMDLIQPKNKTNITLSDLKRNKSAGLVFDMLFDLRKYDQHNRRIDPAFREMDNVFLELPDGTRLLLEGFQKFAAKAYQILAEEETSGYNGLDADDFDDVLDNDDLDWERDGWDN